MWIASLLLGCGGDDGVKLHWPKLPTVDTVDTAGTVDTGYPGAADHDQDGWKIFEGDCDDTDPNRHPGAPELCDGIDSNCSGAEEVDADGDGTLNCVDCNDTNPTVAPGLADTLGDGLDANCDGTDGVATVADAVLRASPTTSSDARWCCWTPMPTAR